MRRAGFGAVASTKLAPYKAKREAAAAAKATKKRGEDPEEDTILEGRGFFVFLGCDD